MGANRGDDLADSRTRTAQKVSGEEKIVIFRSFSVPPFLRVDPVPSVPLRPLRPVSPRSPPVPVRLRPLPPPIPLPRSFHVEQSSRLWYPLAVRSIPNQQLYWVNDQ